MTRKSVVDELGTFPSYEDMKLIGCCFDGTGDDPGTLRRDPLRFCLNEDCLCEDIEDDGDEDHFFLSEGVQVSSLYGNDLARDYSDISGYADLVTPPSPSDELIPMQFVGGKRQPIRSPVFVRQDERQAKPRLGSRDSHGKRLHLLEIAGELTSHTRDLARRPRSVALCHQRETIRKPSFD